MTSPDETNEVYLHHGQSYEEKIENVPVIKEIVTAHCLTGITVLMWIGSNPQVSNEYENNLIFVYFISAESCL